MSGKEYGPVPRIIGIGPIRMTAPPLLLPKFVIEPKAISKIPTKMAAKATRNNTLAKEN